MKALKELLSELTFTCERGNLEKEVTAVVYDSRKIIEGCLFVCIKGANFDGHQAAAEAAEKKAAAITVSKEVELPEHTETTLIRVEDTRYALAFVSAAWFDHPAKKLTTIGITGTKGKTTTTYLVKSILENAGRKVGLVGTIEIIIGDTHIHAVNTTPESYLLQEYFAKMVESGCDTVVMEVSSQALMLHRTQGFVFDFGIFKIWSRIISDRTSMGALKNMPIVRVCCFNSAASGLQTLTMCTGSLLQRSTPAVWKPTACLKKQTCAHRTCSLQTGRDISASPLM